MKATHEHKNLLHQISFSRYLDGLLEHLKQWSIAEILRSERAGELTLQLRTLAAFTEDLSLVPSTHIWRLTADCLELQL